MDAVERCPSPAHHTGLIFSGHAAGGSTKRGWQGTHAGPQGGHFGDLAAGIPGGLLIMPGTAGLMAEGMTQSQRMGEHVRR